MLSACVDWDSIKSVQFFNGAVAHRLSSNNIEQIRCSGKPCTMIHINRFECVRTGPDRSGTLISQFHCSGEYLEDRGWRVSPSSDWSISCETCDPKMPQEGYPRQVVTQTDVVPLHVYPDSCSLYVRVSSTIVPTFTGTLGLGLAVIMLSISIAVMLKALSVKHRKD